MNWLRTLKDIGQLLVKRKISMYPPPEQCCFHGSMLEKLSIGQDRTCIEMLIVALFISEEKAKIKMSINSKWVNYSVFIQ